MKRYSLLYIGVLLLLLSSCVSLDKAVKKVTETETNAKIANQAIKQKYEQVSASDCATWYPITEKVITRTDTLKEIITIPGKEIPCPETVDKKTGKAYTPMVKCPDHSYEQKTIRELTEKTQESTARVRTAELERDKVKQELLDEKKAHLQSLEEKDELRRSRNFYRTFIWVLVGATVVFVALKFLKPF